MSLLRRLVNFLRGGPSSSAVWKPPDQFADRFIELLRALESDEVDYVLVGGMAMNLWGFARATEDIDLFLAPRAENIEALKRALRRVWDDENIDAIETADLMGDYPVVRYGPPDGLVYLDLIVQIGERVAWEDLEYEVLSLEAGVEARVATPRTLYRMKRGTMRPIDQQDVTRLLRAYDSLDEEDP